MARRFGASPLGVVEIDGIAESTYGCPVAVQKIGTGFGNNILTNLMNNTGTFAGSELDASYAVIQNDVLFLVLAGNLEANFNRLDIFFMVGSGGQNTLTNVNPNIDFNGLNNMGAGTGGPGLTFDAGFAPNYWMSVNHGGGAGYAFYVNYAELWPGSTNATGMATNGLYLGSTTITNGTLLGGTNPFGIQATINNSNTNGVDGISCATNALGAAQSIAAGLVRTGIELGIPLAALGSPTGAVAICAFINNGDHTYMANQLLAPLDDGTPGYCQANLGTLGSTRTINLSTLPSLQYFTVGPGPRITNITRSGNDITVSWLTAANSNLVYQLQSTGVLTTNSTWVNVGASTNGTGAIITQTDLMAGTNKPALFYRVKQTPTCP
jgi:hypothetical protein